MGINLQMDYVREFMAELDEKSRLRTAINSGREEGRAEEKLENARKLKALGVDAAIICKATGLSPEEVEAL